MNDAAENRPPLRALLEILGTRVHLPAADAEKVWRLAAAAGLDPERYLIDQMHVPRAELLRVILELKGAYGLPLDGEWVEAAVGKSFDAERAAAARIVPLAVYGRRLYYLQDDAGGAAPPAEYTGVALGAVPSAAARAARLYDVLAKYAAQNKRFGEYLVKLSAVTQEQVDHALDEQRAHGWHLGQTLVREGAMSEQTAAEMLAAFLDLPYYNMARLRELADVEVTRRIPRSFARKNRVIALRKEGDTAWIAAADPQPDEVFVNLAAALECKRHHVGLAAGSDLLNILNSLYGVGGEEGVFVVDSVEAPGDESAAFASGEVRQLMHYILSQGVRQRASDIHVERYEDRVAVKYRIDGVLVEAKDAPLNKGNIAAFLVKLKVDARLDIAERRRPQDGVIRGRIEGQVVDLRIATQPTIWGENAVIRILNQSAGVPTLDELGFSPAVLSRFRRLTQSPQGLVLLTGPTGCGKTTTLYATLKEINNSEIKIVTAEDPVEYAIDGVQQSQINDVIGNTFDRFLKGFLRQDPDVILVGEIRDRETAEMTIRAALTGHLIFSTLHVNDAVGVVRRLMDLGVEPNLISQTLLCVIGQRLARKNCPRCLEPYTPDAELLREFRALNPAGLRRGRGCPACRHSGYAGRTALVEFWEPDQATRDLIDRRADTSEVLKAAIAGGMTLLIDDALAKVEAGKTTLEELRNTISPDQIAFGSAGRAAP